MLTRDQVLPEPTEVVIDGVSIATWILEPPGTSLGDVVLCHGTPWSAQVWRIVARELGRDHRVFLWDMPGYGDSEKGPTVATDLRTQAERLVALVQFWGLRRPHVIAHDIGGAIALRAHLLHGVDYADLYLWDVVTLDPWGSPFFRLVAENANVFAQLPANLHAALVKEYIAGAASRALSAQDLDVLAAPWLDPVGQTAFFQQIASLSVADTRPAAERLGFMRCPTRIGWGRDDPWIPVPQAHELQSRLPGNSDLVLIDGVGHLAPLEDPSAVATAVRNWLTRSSDTPDPLSASNGAPVAP
ncbi:alpha/beta fold hydrolase [Microbacterium sp. G2-8]|uniref:alpha/beta fold hydrolase n=1 Tax=Microbacterium sp. G2-8 TaxID=2842454 RepID=UPI001C88EB20|nr:alpha/beta hydrolase [Microbacterium sp. G2-8]